MEEERRLQAYFRDSHAAQDAYEYSTDVAQKQSTVRRAALSALKSVLTPKSKRDDQKSISDIVRREGFLCSNV